MGRDWESFELVDQSHVRDRFAELLFDVLILAVLGVVAFVFLCCLVDRVFPRPPKEASAVVLKE